MSKQETVYVETSVVSYLTARPSWDLVATARQQFTAAWWAHRRKLYRVVASPLVVEEAGRGDPVAASDRLDVLRGLAVVGPTTDTDALAEALMHETPLPAKAAADAVHIAVASTAGADYLLTWNFRHIANPVLRDQIARVCRSLGHEPPTLCSPEDLLEGTDP